MGEGEGEALTKNVIETNLRSGLGTTKLERSIIICGKGQ